MANEIEQIDFTTHFKTLVEDVFVMSETDAPLKPFEWKNIAEINDTLLLKKAKATAETALEKCTIDDFFQNKITPQDWHGEEEKESVLKFQNILTALQSTLYEPSVYRIGDARKDVFIVGKLQNGNVGGLKTYVVET